MSEQGKSVFGEDWELSEDFYKESAGKKELSLEDFMEDDSAKEDAASASGKSTAVNRELEQVAEQVKQVIALSGQGRTVAEIAAQLHAEESYIHDMMVCVQAFTEDDPMAVARLLVMG